MRFGLAIFTFKSEWIWGLFKDKAKRDHYIIFGVGLGIFGIGLTYEKL